MVQCYGGPLDGHRQQIPDGLSVGDTLLIGWSQKRMDGIVDDDKGLPTSWVVPHRDGLLGNAPYVLGDDQLLYSPQEVIGA